MSKTIVPQIPKITKNRKAEVIQLSDEKPTQDQQLWAADNLAVPTVVVFSDECKIREYGVEEGDEWLTYFRDAGYIIAIPGERFEIRLFRWATIEDLDWFEERIRAAKEGMIAHWRPRTKDNPGLYFGYDRAIDLTKSRGWLLVECDEPHCILYRSKDLPFHVTGSDDIDGEDWWFDHDASLEFTTDGYEIRLHRVFNESDWTVRVYANDCTLTTAQAAGMASDLQWASAEARKLNGAAGADPATVALGQLLRKV